MGAPGDETAQMRAKHHNTGERQCRIVDAEHAASG